MEINVLLLGTMISKSQKDIFMNAGIRPAPADIAQTYILDGLKSNKEIGLLEVISSPRIAAYPSSRIMNVKTEDWDEASVHVKTVGFLNFPILGFVQRAINIIQETKRWTRKTKGKKVIISYSMSTPFLLAMAKAKKIDNDLHKAIIVPDLPMFMGNYGFIKKCLKKIDSRIIDYFRKDVDSYILYTKYMADALHISSDRWIVMEGLFDTTRIKPNHELPNSKNKICIYAGSLNPQYAINQLVDAFERINGNDELHIYGDSSSNESLFELLKKVKKTKYMGMLSSDEMFCEMKKADLLINPRPSNLELAKYSCPSKTFEYMASGTAVLMTKLPGIPEEYYKYVYTFDEESEEGFMRALDYVLSLPRETLRETGKQAQTFLINNKSTIKQTERIIHFVNR